MTEFSEKQTEATFSGAKPEVLPDDLREAGYGIDDEGNRFEIEPEYEADVPPTPEEIAAQNEVECLRISESIDSQAPRILELMEGAMQIADEGKMPDMDPETFESEDDSQWPSKVLYKLAESIVHSVVLFTPEDFRLLPQATKDILILCERYFIMRHSVEAGTPVFLLDRLLSDEEKQLSADDYRKAVVKTYPEAIDEPWLDYSSPSDIYGVQSLIGTDQKPVLSHKYTQHELYDVFPESRVIRPYLEPLVKKVKAAQEV